MGGLSPEYLQRVQKGIGGIGQGVLLGQQLKRQRVQREEDIQRSDKQRKEDIQLMAAKANLRPIAVGETPDTVIGDFQFKKIPELQKQTEIIDPTTGKVIRQTTANKVKLLQTPKTGTKPKFVDFSARLNKAFSNLGVSGQEDFALLSAPNKLQKFFSGVRSKIGLKSKERKRIEQTLIRNQIPPLLINEDLSNLDLNAVQQIIDESLLAGDDINSINSVLLSKDPDNPSLRLIDRFKYQQ